MRAIVQKHRVATDFQTMDIGHLAEFLNITIKNLDELNAQEKTALLKQLVAISQMKLTRLALRH
jgi:hypothetical protein